LAAISLETVPVTPMTFVKFNLKLANPSKIMKFRKQEYADLHLHMAKHVVIQERQGDYTASVFLKESFRPVVCTFGVEWSYICIYVRLVLTDSNTMAFPILHLTHLNFNFWGHRNYEI
jgi:hypothetical protein